MLRNDTETFAYRLARQLPDRRVVNLGVPGYGTDQELVQLEAYFDSRKTGAISDIVVLVFENAFTDTLRGLDPYLGCTKPVFHVVIGQLDPPTAPLATGVPVVIAEFDRLTGCPVIVNTSFNVRGEPIVCTPEDAYRCFIRTEMDALVLETFVLEKARQPAAARDESWQATFTLD